MDVHERGVGGTSRGEPDGVVLTPARPAGLRVTGPGRVERSYRRRINDLEGEVDRRTNGLAMLRRELAIAQLVERGTGRVADRLEGELDRARQQASRLLVTLGALQRENEGLRAELASARTRLARLSAPARAPFWKRLLPSRARRS